MNLTRVRSLILCAFPISFPLIAACNAPADEGDEPVGVTAQALTNNGVTQVSAGDRTALAVKADGTVWSVGYNAHGQLGDGTTADRITPAQISGLSGVAAVAEGQSDYSLALKSDKTLVAWGSNIYGQLGIGSLTNFDQLTPTSVTTMRLADGSLAPISPIEAVSAGHIHPLALTSDKTVLAWGFNSYGQLGDGAPPSYQPTPGLVKGQGGIGVLSDIKAVAGGAAHSLALTSDGQVFAFGLNASGQLGDVSNANRNTPVPVSMPAGSIVKAVAAGDYASFALTSDGKVFAWGHNNLGQLGDGTTLDQNTPVPVLGPNGVGVLSGVKALVAAREYALALQEDGTLWAWGRGQLGAGPTPGTGYTTPVQILSDVTAMEAGQFHSFALKSDGTVVGWGNDDKGQIGDGTTVGTQYTPVRSQFDWGSWPMSNPVSTGLPHPASYASMTGYVIDKVSGLEWQQPIGIANDLGATCAGGCSQPDAISYCASLTLAGHDDWRLPTRIELVSIVDDTAHAPAIDHTVFPGTPNGYFWSSSAVVQANNAFRIGGNEGDTAYGMQSGLGPVRCVRSAGAPASQYSIQAGTVLDTVTGLTWQQAVPAQTYDHVDALGYCSSNTAALPGSGWRLPSMKELQTLVKDNHASPAVDTIAFPSTPTDLAYWTSTAVAWQQPGYAWEVMFNIGQSVHHAVSNARHVRCVR